MSLWEVKTLIPEFPRKVFKVLHLQAIRLGVSQRTESLQGYEATAVNV